MFGLRAAVQHDEDLEVVVGLAQAGGNRLREVCVALVGRDAERHAGGHGSPLFSAEGCGGFRAPSPTLSRRARGRPRPRVGHRQAGHLRDQRRRRPRPARGLPAHGGRERLHPDPVRGDDALRRLQRPPGRIPAVGGRRGRFGGEPRRARGSPTRSAITVVSSCSRSTGSSCTSRPRTSRGPTAGSSATARRPSSSAGCCRSSAPSSRCRRAWRGCRSGSSAC